MTEDARFEDGGEQPLRLRALDAEDLAVISGLVQDGVLPGGEMTWDRKARRFGMLVNRFRWEDAPKAQARARDYERVQAVIAIENVELVRVQGIDPSDKDTVLSVLAITFEPGEDGAGHVLVTLAGDGAIRVQVEALEVLLRDVTRPYRAPSGKAPAHE
ncbi:DUF2948 family protein [Pelagovum pacificum]|uniref:DUF2948 family protein n=1 Tax=Pelagovum pacificum TaxID=2588711 RepID=A0A5C5GFP6_9RHOB|nr:DUF2948 family protein [Pelagovum pacificum]QQA43976.1 DUF2948 family protein [Pelagovum pacificum]TNY32897.1 DUF2948 family protein [Pelagovum pacificum]